MNTTPAVNDARFVAIGRVTRPFGRHGEVVVRPAAGDPARFAELEQVFLAREGEAPRPFEVRSMRVLKGLPTLGLENVEGIGEAESLKGSDVLLPAGDIPALDEGSFYHYELVGLCAVDAQGGAIGVVEDVMDTGGTDVLVIRGPGGDEVLVPFCTDLCPRVDLGRGVVEVAAIDGLLDANREPTPRRGNPE